MKKILVATDFSNAGKNAARYAVQLSKVTHGEIVLFNSNIPYLSINEGMVSGLIQNDKFANKEILEAEALALKNSTSVQIDFVASEGPAMQEILSIVESEDIDLVVVGMKESDALTGFVFGSLITDLIKESPVPIFVIPEKAIFKRIERIVFAIDFKLENEIRMHKLIKGLLQIFSPEIFILNVVKENATIRPDEKVSENNIERYFENIKHIYSFIENNDIVDGLNEFILQNKIDIITMLPHKHSLLQSVFVESKTKQMASNSTIPIIVLPITN